MVQCYPRLGRGDLLLMGCRQVLTSRARRPGSRNRSCLRGPALLARKPTLNSDTPNLKLKHPRLCRDQALPAFGTLATYRPRIEG